MWYISVLSLVLFGSFAESATPILSCYYTNWAQYRPDPMKFFPEDIDPFMCTHIIYAFADLKNNHLTPFEYNDDDFPDGTPGMYRRVNDRKTINPDLKVLLAVGGWNMGSGPFMQMVETKETRADFISHSIGFLRDRNFDGLDLDWEYPSGVYKDKFTLLVQELRMAYNSEGSSTGRPPLMITAATPAGEGTLNYAYDIGAVSKELDFFNIMTYDMAGSWDPMVGHHTNLYSAPGDTGNLVAHVVDYVTKDYMRRGCPPEKVVVGCATYGRSFRLSTSDNMPGAPASGGASPGDFTQQGGIWSQYEICDRLDNGFTSRWDNDRKVPHAYSSSEWVGYEDPESIRLKAEYVLTHGLGGAMVWALDLDDFKGYYCTNAFPGTGAWSIMTELKRGLHGDQYLPPTYPPRTTPDPNAFKCDNMPNGLYPDPWDCTKYYNCWEGQTNHITCPNGLFYNPNGYCDDPSNVPCDNYIPPTYPTPDPNAFTCKDKPDGYYPDPYDCTKYYYCSWGNANHLQCANGGYWNPLGYCDYPENVPCDNGSPPPTGGPPPTNPQTTKPGPTQPPPATTQSPPGDFTCTGRPNGCYADPKNCNMWYECWGGVKYHKTCATGLYFNIDFCGCDWPENVKC